MRSPSGSRGAPTSLPRSGDRRGGRKRLAWRRSRNARSGKYVQPTTLAANPEALGNADLDFVVGWRIGIAELDPLVGELKVDPMWTASARTRALRSS